MARNFPRLNRLWNGTPTGSPRDGQMTDQRATSRSRATAPTAGDGRDPRRPESARPTAHRRTPPLQSGSDRVTSPYPDICPTRPTPPTVQVAAPDVRTGRRVLRRTTPPAAGLQPRRSTRRARPAESAIVAAGRHPASANARRSRRTAQPASPAPVAAARPAAGHLRAACRRAATDRLDSD